MKRTPSLGEDNSGFTVVETLIVLAITGMLFLSAILLVAGQQRKVEFNQAINEVQSSINQIISEVSTGYYPNGGNIRCTVAGSIMTVTSVPVGTPRGSNDGCIFLGKTIQFGENGDASQYIVHSMTGFDDNDGTIKDVLPRTIDIDSARVFGRLRNGLTVHDMRYVTSTGTTQRITAVAFVNGLGSYNASDELQSGSQQVALVPVPGSGITPYATVPSTRTAINNQLEDAGPLMNPPSDTQVQICFRGGGNQYAQVTLGGNGRSTSVKLDVKTAVCW